jgi:hypothetical protein
VFVTWASTSTSVAHWREADRTDFARLGGRDCSVPEFTDSDLRFTSCLLLPIWRRLPNVTIAFQTAPNWRTALHAMPRRCVATTSPTVVARGASGRSAMSPTCPFAACLTGPESGQWCRRQMHGHHGRSRRLTRSSEGLDRVRDVIEEAQSFLSLTRPPNRRLIGPRPRHWQQADCRSHTTAARGATGDFRDNRGSARLRWRQPHGHASCALPRPIPGGHRCRLPLIGWLNPPAVV